MINFDNILFNIDISPGIPRPGSLLVAEPFLREQYFSHAVITLIEYAPGGSAMGIVLTRMTGHPLQSLVGAIKIKEPIPVFCGGPLSCDRLYFIHTLGELLPGARHIARDLYIGGDFNTMVDYTNSGYPVDGLIRFFIGYSGWSENQLDTELRQNVWAVTDLPDPTSHILTGEEDTFWHNIVRSLGPKYRGWLYHPQNPHAN